MSSDRLLENISSPNDLKRIDEKKLPQLCEEIREELISTVSKNGGHLASNLGVVELTVALHSVFNSPKDQIIFDVGHQCYTHKLLTGRFKEFSALRKEDGISGFPKPKESEHDPMIAGHSSTSISAACGLLAAKEIKKEDDYVVAVIGDGALSGGLAYEGLNNAGRNRNGRMVVILNDNKMSISRNVGSMSRYLAVIRTKSSYIRMKGNIDKAVSRIPLVGKGIRNWLYGTKMLVKNIFYKSTIFEDMGFIYLGPVDGHDINLVRQALNVAKEYNRPILLHVCTIKGKGYKYAERNPRSFHGVSKFDVKTGQTPKSSKCFSDIFGETLCQMAKEDEKICAITAAMKSGTGLDDFASKYSDRFFDVGIAEEHAVTFAAGLATNGLKPVFAVYSSFLQRSYDQIIHDVAIQNLNVVFAVDRAGIVGEDGVTHQGIYDTAFLNTIPNIKIYCPTYFSELELFLKKAIDEDGPVVVRYPRGKELQEKPCFYEQTDKPFSLYEKKDSKVMIVVYGRCFSNAVIAQQNLEQEGILASVLKLNCVKPIDLKAIKSCLNFEKVFFFEEGSKSGGIGERFGTMLQDENYVGKYKLISIDEFISHSTVESAFEKYRLDAKGMVRTITVEKA